MAKRILGGAFAAMAVFCFAWASAAQFVFLDFDSGNDANVKYTTSMPNQIVNDMQSIYSNHDIIIQDTLPVSPFSRIRFNESGSGGLALQIDLRNLDRDDSAVVNVTGLGLSANQFANAYTTIGAHELGCLLGLRLGGSWGSIGTGHGSSGRRAEATCLPIRGIEISNLVMRTPALGANIQTASNPHWLNERSTTKLTFLKQGTFF